MVIHIGFVILIKCQYCSTFTGPDVATLFQVIEHDSPCHKEYPDQSTLLGWMHCHFNGVKCHLSSIDLHKQFILEQTFPHVLSIVVEIGPKGKKKHEFCQLSEKGIQRVLACNQEECKKDKNVSHKACSYPRFTKFVKNQIIFNNNTIRVIANSNPDEFSLQEDTNNSEPGPSNFVTGKKTLIHNNSGASKKTIGSNESKLDKSSKIAESEDNLIECRGCKKKVSSIRLHLRKKSCKQQYTEKEYSEFVKVKAAEKSVYLKKYKQSNKNALKKKRQENAKKNKEALKKKRQDNAKAIKESEKARQIKSRSNKRKSVTSQGRVLAFKRDIIDGPNFVCFSCNRCLFKSSVRILKENDIAKLVAKISADLIIEAGLEA